MLKQWRALIYTARVTGAADARLPAFHALFFLITPEIEQELELVFCSVAEADNGLQ